MLLKKFSILTFTFSYTLLAVGSEFIPVPANVPLKHIFTGCRAVMNQDADIWPGGDAPLSAAFDVPQPPNSSPKFHATGFVDMVNHGSTIAALKAGDALTFGNINPQKADISNRDSRNIPRAVFTCEKGGQCEYYDAQLQLENSSHRFSLQTLVVIYHQDLDPLPASFISAATGAVGRLLATADFHLECPRSADVKAHPTAMLPKPE